MMRLLDTLIGRTILVSLFGITLMHVLSLWSYDLALNRELSRANETRFAEQLITIRRSVGLVPAAGRETIAHGLSGGPLDVHWSLTERAVPGGPGLEQWQRLPERLGQLAPELQSADIAIGTAGNPGEDAHLALISMRLPDDSWVNVSLFAHGHPRTSGHGTLLSTTVMALGVVILSVLIARWLTRPIRTVANAVRALHPGAEGTRIPELGPREVRDLAIAFNDMQRRIKQLIDERTRALAAVSHDLRTPLTRLKLRVEDLGNPEISAAITGDVAELEQMIDATLSYLRGEETGEEVRPIDLTALLKTLIDDATDIGIDASLSGPRSVVIRGRRLGLKRAFSNLIQNAVKYGARVRIGIEVTPVSVSVHIDDDGTGIASDNMESVFEPFVRIETSRSRETGGVGLGLTIAKANIAMDHGTLTLANRPEGGLRATVSLPLAVPAATACNNL